MFACTLYTNEYYHIYNRGNNGDNLFFEGRNYSYFLKLYAQYIYPIAQTYCYCLMPNHFHLLVKMREYRYSQDWQSPKDCQSLIMLDSIDYSKAFANLFSTYTKAINKSYKRTGSLFEKPFKRIHVDNDAYFKQLVSYIHRNPQKHGFVSDFREYPYSSYHTLVNQKYSRLETEQVFNWFATLNSFEHYHIQFDDDVIDKLYYD